MACSSLFFFKKSLINSNNMPPNGTHKIAPNGPQSAAPIANVSNNKAGGIPKHFFSNAGVRIEFSIN